MNNKKIFKIMVLYEKEKSEVDVENVFLGILETKKMIYEIKYILNCIRRRNTLVQHVKNEIEPRELI